ncbi:esterase-like activity of phytase family protein [Angustibacter luteus]|uniref:Esterase-like activity of phytase family protein n=1 Tax=Angustibacter luteus TaxID=658456 RepID=A0ABW1JEZ6_9ACTN
MSLRARHLALVLVPVTAAALGAVPAAAVSPKAPTGPTARADGYVAFGGRTLTLPAALGVTANDRVGAGGARTVVQHTDPAHGSLALAADGSLRYRPAAGFHGRDTFSYTMTDAVSLYPTHLPALATIDGTTLSGGAYGSGLTPVPGVRNEFYGLTDRGPNVDGPGGVKVEPLPSFTPAIGRFRLVSDALGTRAQLVRSITLKAADGSPYNGQVNALANTGETILDRDGAVLPASANGYDPEGLVALRDGTFWVSDEYGPFITHVDANGRAIERLSPYDGSLPRELANRVPNKGMEGLTITPDGRTLVGIMQNALQAPDVTGKTGSYPVIRIVTVDLRTRAQHEYVYLLDDPQTTNSGVSEITALSATTFLVDERDGLLEPGAYKKLWKIDLAGATDVGPATTAGTYDVAEGGLVAGGGSLEKLVGKATTAAAQETLAGVGVTPVRKTPGLDLGALVSGLDPSGGFFGHDKVEGVTTVDGGRTLVISNDSDFGIDAVTTDAPPFGLHAKVLPNGTQDDGEYLAVDTTRLVGGAARTSTATVTIYVP